MILPETHICMVSPVNNFVISATQIFSRVLLQPERMR